MYLLPISRRPFLWSIALLLWLVANCYEITAQQYGLPYFRNYSSDEGLASEEVHDILQDRKGYLWIATDNGVSRFDGYIFENYGAREGLKNNVVFYLQEDEEGKIWMQTMSGNVYYHWQDSIYPYPYNRILQKYCQQNVLLPDGFIISLYDWSYFALSGLGIIAIDPEGHHKILNKPYPFGLIVLEKPEYKESLFAPVNNLAFLSFGLNPDSTGNTKSKCIVGIMGDSLKNKFDLAIPSGTTRTTVFSDGNIQVYDLKQQLIVMMHHQLQAQYSLPAKMASIEKLDSTFWIGFNNGKGVRAYRGDRQMLANQFDLYLEGQSISDVCKDQTGGYWFGSLEKGIFYAPNLDLKVFGQEALLSEDPVTVLEKWKDDKLLMGNNSGLVLTLDPRGKIDTLLSCNSPIFDLSYDAEEDLIWVGTIRLFAWKAGKRAQVNYAPELGKDSYKNAVIAKKILRSRKDSILYINSAQGMEMLNAHDHQVFFSPTSEDTIGSRRVLVTFEDMDARVWIGNTYGLFQFDGDTFSPPAYDHPIFHIRIEDIKQLQDGTLVLGTKGSGVALWKDTTVTIIDESHGLTANMVENLAVDAYQNIWVGTLNGLNVLKYNDRLQTWIVSRITKAHGLPSNGIYDLCPDGDRIYVATAGGVVPLPIEEESTAGLPQPFIEQILVNGQIADTDQLLRLKFSERNIQLHYVCINYKFDGSLTYRYRLTSEPDWSYTKDRSVNYAALSPGQYIFELQAQNEDWEWSDPVLIPFSIAKPFWKEWWFFVILVALFSFIAYLIYKERISRLQKEAAIEREISELQRSALQAQMNPHFIFNCLNSIQNFIASGDKQNAMQYLSRFATLVRSTLNASVQDTITLEEELLVIENYLELEKLRFGKKFEYEVKVDPQIDQFDTCIPPLLIQPFVENAILHGFNFEDKNKTGRILIAYERDNGLLRITVRDNGIGIFHSRKAKEHTQPMRKSLGMSITEKRLALHNGISTQDQFEVAELKGSNESIVGTEIIIRIKS